MSFFSLLRLPVLRPPGALPEQDFLAHCIHCGQCIEVCPEHCLFPDSSFSLSRNSPTLHPQQAPCTLCLKCPPVCPSGALDTSLTRMEDVRMGRAILLTERCHNFTDGPMCWTCYDRCPLRGKAIVLEAGIRPAVTQDCVGCGVCAYVCPIKAITILPHTHSQSNSPSL